MSKKYLFTIIGVLASWSLILAGKPSRASDPTEPADLITLERIMADPDWIGRSPENPYWAADGRSFYYRQKRVGEDRRDLMRMALDGAPPRVVSDDEKSTIDVAGGAFSRDRRRKVYANHGDLFLKNVASGTIRQLTRTAIVESAPRFMVGGDRIIYRRGSATLVRELDSGLEYQPADLRPQDDPEKKKDESFDYLKDQQERLFQSIRDKKEKTEKAKARRRDEQQADKSRTALPWYLGKDVSVIRQVLSPTGDWMVLVLGEKKKDEAKSDTMPQYVSETGYVTTQSVRSKVGTGKPMTQRLVLLDLAAHERHDIDLSVLPGISEDPLKALKDAAKKASEMENDHPEEEPQASTRAAENNPTEEPRALYKARAATTMQSRAGPGATSSPTPKPRPVSIRDITWTKEGLRVAVQFFSMDNKDRWIATIDLNEARLVPLLHFTDEAWINYRFTRIGWLKDNQTLYYLSEEDGYSHIALRSATDETHRRLTEGRYEVTSLTLSYDGHYLYYLANATHPSTYEVYRVDVDDGGIELLTSLGGRNRYILSPDQRNFLITHSTTTRPPELYIQSFKPGATARRMTHTVSEAFTSLPWIAPKIITIPSTHIGRNIYARFHKAAGPSSQSAGSRQPAVVFIHGAGYMQEAHAGWSYYFREFMFHTLLVRRGYVVLDMDYRASAGYGRDWRAAIYRQMGTPELEDIEDGVAWLIAHHNVDPDRIGVYGGSYGGFLTFMALFRKPDLFACGAALRPVTDWAHYNHGYTSNILNTPQVDPAAYQRSSPIEFAEGLKKPLLICHGMQDDNVFFQDTVRLVQRLIELKKENWEVAIYPVEPHSFRRPESWLDEYRRILKLFETHLKK